MTRPGVAEALDMTLPRPAESVVVSSWTPGERGPHIASVNDALLVMTGFNSDQLLGRPIETLFGRHGALPGLGQRDARTPQPIFISGPVAVRRADGSTLDVVAESFPLRVEADAPPYAMTVLRSRDAGRQLRCRLEEIQSSFKALKNIARAGSWVVEPGTDWAIRCSPEMLEIFGLSSDELERDANAFKSRFHPDDWERIGRAMRAVLVDNESVDLEHRIVLPTGEVRWAYARITPGTGGTEMPYRAVGIVFDVTDRVRAERGLRDIERRFQAAADASMDGLMLLQARRDQQDRITDFEFTQLNPCAERMLARTRAQVTGRGLHELWPTEDTRAHIGRLARVVETGEPLQETVEIALPGLGSTWCDVRVVAVGDDVAATVHDVTKERLMRSELARGQRLTTVGQVAAGVAHDFNNMLSTILGVGQLVRDSLPDPERDDMGVVLEAAERGGLLAQRLLAFSRGGALEPRDTDLSRLIEGLMPLLEHLAGRRIRWRLDLGYGLPKVCVDPTQAEQAIVNLVANARDAMPDGGVLGVETVCVKARAVQSEVGQELPPGEYVRLEVADTGTGMTPDVKEHIFEPFFTTKQPPHGTGLGLASVEEFVRASRGHITVDSNIGAGTTFALFLPTVPFDRRGAVDGSWHRECDARRH